MGDIKFVPVSREILGLLRVGSKTDLFVCCLVIRYSNGAFCSGILVCSLTIKGSPGVRLFLSSPHL